MRAADHPSAGALFAAHLPSRADEPARWREEDAKGSVTRWVAESHSCDIAAYASLWCVKDDRYRLDLIVAADHRRRGLGGRLLQRVTERAVGSGAATLQARSSGDDIDSLRFLERRAFTETMRMDQLELDVARANLEPFSELGAHLEARGITITTLAEEGADDAQVWERLRDVHEDARHGWPDPDPSATSRPPTVEDVRSHMTLWSIDPSEYFIAKRGDEYVGFSGPAGTGVRRSDRNGGIATALKVRWISLARERGVASMKSSSGNPAMLHVNAKLGYHRTWTEVRLVRRFRDAARRAAEEASTV